MAINARNVEALRKSLYIPVNQMNGYVVDLDLLLKGGDADGAAVLYDGAALTSFTKAAETDAHMVLAAATAAADKNARLRGIGNGNPRLVSVAGLNMAGLLLTTANDGVEFCGLIPSDLDVTKKVGVRCWWASEAAAVGNRTITFQAKYGLFEAEEALAVAATALDTALVADPAAGATKKIQRTERGIVNAGKIATDKLFWSWKVIMSAFHEDFTEAKYLLGLELDYIPRIFTGPRQVRDNTPANLADTRGS